jgi:mRNA-degrading endonuclease RelE of RelBE toxin-antitoxin system
LKYNVVISKEAIKELDRLPKKLEQRIQNRFNEIAINPLDSRISDNVEMMPGQRYSRVGDWRLFMRCI